MLRDYQKRAIHELYHWFRHNTGHPCLVLPTGSGKSHVIAALCQDAITTWPDTKILMLTHVKELIEQNAGKLRTHWPDAPLGIYSAGMGKKELGMPITFAGIQSVRGKAKEIGHVDIILCDECHLIGHAAQDSYRTLIADLEAINPNLRVVGLTATPYRLGHGLITDNPALFDDLIEPVDIEALTRQGYLAPLRSKATCTKLSVDGVHKRGGEFIERELQRAVDVHETSEAVIDEVINLAGKRKSWLFFCTGVDHAGHVKDILNSRDIPAACITGKTPMKDREQILAAFTAGRIRALTNANVLTTGFDYPDIDLIVMMRPTMSPGLYVQMAGRGMRPKSHTDHCLVLDFAGVVQMHGPITSVHIPGKPGSAGGVTPAKVCPNCDEIIKAQVKLCPLCGYAYPQEKPKRQWQLHEDDIMGKKGQQTMRVRSWKWEIHIGRKSGQKVLKVTYLGALSDRPVREYFPIYFPGYPGDKAWEAVREIGDACGAQPRGIGLIQEICHDLNGGNPPEHIRFCRKDGFYQIKERIWKDETREHSEAYQEEALYG